MMISPRPEVLALSEAVHGAVNDAELADRGIDPRTILDFSASINPFGPSPKVLEALTNAPIDRYPDREATALRQALAAQLDVPVENLIAGNGSSELLYLIALAFFRPNDAVVIVGPTYSEYARVATLMGAKLIHCDATAGTNFEVPVELVSRSLHSLRPRALFLCHPNNPTGKCLPADIVRQWAEDFSETLFIIDEAYIEFSPITQSLVSAKQQNIVVLRSLTKAYGLAGLRLGYAIADPEIIRVLCRVRPPWSVNAVAQAAGVAALNDSAHLQQSVTTLLAEKKWLLDELQSLGLSTYPSSANFFLVRVTNATQVRQRLLESRILVRDCTSFGLPEFLRISPRCRSENTALFKAWRQIKQVQCPAAAPASEDGLQTLMALSRCPHR